MGDFRKKTSCRVISRKKKIPGLKKKSLIAYNAEKNGQPHMK